jgi:hypothetical protein
MSMGGQVVVDVALCVPSTHPARSCDESVLVYEAAEDCIST